MTDRERRSVDSVQAERSPSNAIAAVKRDAVARACEPCRRARAKCDGRSRCARCALRRIECVFSGESSESPRQSLKRKYEEFAQLYERLRKGDDRQSRQVLARVRANESIESILKSEEGPQSWRESNIKRRSQLFLIALVQTTGPLSDLVRLATRILLNGENGVSIATIPPDLTAYEILRDSVFTIDTLTNILTQPPRLGFVGISSSPRIADGYNGSPLHWVSAAPWTTITDKDEVVSHLVSVFLALINGYWRFLEQDVFLRAARSGRVDSDYCSPFLVNTILACASLYTEIEEAFDTPGQLLTRGEHFHREAITILETEAQASPSIPSIQGMFILAMDCCIRGKDKFGLELKGKAVAMHSALAHTADGPSLILTSHVANYMRIRQSLAWTTVWMDFSYALGLLAPFESTESSLRDTSHDLEKVLPDTVVYWPSYPLALKPMPLRMNTLMLLRCKLNVLIVRLFKDLFSRDAPGTKALMLKVNQLRSDLMAWHDSLPADLKCTNTDTEQAVVIFEFHGQYLSVEMTLRSRALELLDKLSPPTTSQRGKEHATNVFAATVHEEKIALAHQTARYLRAFRKTYGCKITPPEIMHPAALATSILLHAMRDFQQRPGPRPSPSSITAEAEIENSFEECFRCLLGMGMQNLLPRAVARMMYRASTQLQVRLPENVLRMLEILAETAWQASDLKGLNSLYPNWTLSSGRREDGWLVEQMPHWLRKWEDLEREDDESYVKRHQRSESTASASAA